MAGLVASYYIRPGNGEGIFFFVLAFHIFVTYLLTYLLMHLPTYLQHPGTTRGFYNRHSLYIAAQHIHLLY